MAGLLHCSFHVGHNTGTLCWFVLFSVGSGRSSSVEPQKSKLPMNCRVSILIPAYNAERFVGAALQSALDQTWPDTEIILVDDGSKDQTLAVARRHESAKVKIMCQENRGAAQLGIRRCAKPKVISFNTSMLTIFLARIRSWSNSSCCGRTPIVCPFLLQSISLMARTPILDY